MFVLTAILILLSMGIAIYRALKGPTIYDRTLSVNNFGTVTVLFIAVFGFLTERPEFLDIAMVYALINFITTIAILKFFEYGDIAVAGKGDNEIDL